MTSPYRPINVFTCRKTYRRIPVRIFPALAAIASLALIGCQARNNPGTEKDSSPTLYVTSLPVFSSFIHDIAGDRSAVKTLLSNGQSPHGYQPRPSDAKSIADARLVILGSPVLDGWASRFSPDKSFYLSELVSDSLLLHTGTGSNPHFWTDPLLMKAIIPLLVDRLCSVDSDGCPTYRNNADSVTISIDELHLELTRNLLQLRDACTVSSQPFFDYFLRRYQIVDLGALENVPGHSVSPLAVTQLLKEVSEKSCVAIVAQQSSPTKLVNMFAEESGIAVIYLDIINASSRESYVQIISRNAEKFDVLIPSVK
jgi:ABC-type Zn uptake system ZnuABC Zn-binding protein ZnuA